METFKDRDSKKLDDTALGIIIDACKDTLLTKDHFVLGIPGGRAVQGILKSLKGIDSVPWKKIHIFMVDERLTGPEDKDSNFGQAKELFIGHLLKNKAIDKSNVHPFVLKDNIKESLDGYRQNIISYGSRYDLMILSSGEDCHVGSLFADHGSVLDDSDYYIHVDDSPKPPSERISMSRKMMLRSASCILLFYGESKRGAYLRFKDRQKNIINCPAKIAEEIKNSYIFTDIH